MTKGAAIVLASASPRRREILATLGIEVQVRPTHADEGSLDIADDVAFVRAAALLKLRSALGDEELGTRFVLSADTIVCVAEERLGKPRDEADALRMLQRLSGRQHVVRTAIALGRGGSGELDCRVVETRVWFGPATRR